MAENPVIVRTAITLTAAVGRALAGARDHTWQADLLFLERWEQAPIPGAAAALRINQIRRANPALVAEIRAELRHGRPLTSPERDALEQEAHARLAAEAAFGGMPPQRRTPRRPPAQASIAS